MSSLANLGCVYRIAGRFADAIAATTEAIEYLRALVTASPQAVHRIALADALLDLAGHNLARGTGHDAALDALVEAVVLYANCEESHPGLFHDRFAIATAFMRRMRLGVPPAPRLVRRYNQRWREVAVRVPLPGVALITFWRTVSATPPADRSGVGEEVAALADQPAADPVSGTVPTASTVAGSVARIRADVGTWLTHRPRLLQTGVRLVHEHGDLVRGAATALAAVPVALAALLLPSASEPHVAAAAPPAVTSRPPIVPPSGTGPQPPSATTEPVLPGRTSSTAGALQVYVFSTGPSGLSTTTIPWTPGSPGGVAPCSPSTEATS